MPADSPKARDLELLDAVDALPRESFRGTAWRVVREGRDPLIGSPSLSRWCNGAFDVLYTSLELDGALAEIFSLLSSQPVFPSRPIWAAYELDVATTRSLRLANVAALGKFGVETSTYRERRYEQTQALADAAYFLDFDGLIVPSARWDCLNLVLFTSRLAPEDLALAKPEGEPIDWQGWRKRAR